MVEIYKEEINSSGIIYKAEINASGVKFYMIQNGREVARARLYLLHNDLHAEPFGFMEDVFIDETLRGKGYGSKLVNAVLAEAQERGCYKLICTSRHTKPHVHKLYKKLGFKNHGIEYRIDL